MVMFECTMISEAPPQDLAVEAPTSESRIHHNEGIPSVKLKPWLTECRALAPYAVDCDYQDVRILGTVSLK